MIIPPCPISYKSNFILLFYSNIVNRVSREVQFIQQSRERINLFALIQSENHAANIGRCQYDTHLTSIRLTLMGQGSWMLLEGGGGLNLPTQQQHLLDHQESL